MAKNPPNPGLAEEVLERRWMAILRQLQELTIYLMDQGTLSSRLASGRRVWSVRLYVDTDSGQRRQKAIYVGSNPVLIGRVQDFLDHCREQGDLFRSVESCERLAGTICRAAGRLSNGPT